MQPNPDKKVINNVTNNASFAEEIYKKNLELLESRRRAEQLLYGLAEAVFAVDEEYNITLFNNSLEKIINKKLDDVLNLPVNQVINLTRENGEPVDVKELCFVNEEEKKKVDGLILKGATSDYYVNVRSSIINPLQGRQECLVTMVDVTKEKQLEKAKDDFISITSHELRTPMTIIKSYLWMLGAGKGGNLTVKQMEYVQKAAHGTERMLALINDMLSISRMEQGRMEIKIEKLALMENISDTLEDFDVKCKEKNVECKIDIPSDIPYVFADNGKLNEIIINLMGNALKFTNQGSITLSAETIPNDMIKISVQDTGKGIQQEDMKRLFHKFGRLNYSYQTVAESGGTGLGLYIVKLYVEHMGGEVGVSSKGENQGTTFWFTLPTKEMQSQQLQEKNDPEMLVKMQRQPDFAN
jgi:signal transduction histidine kinase